MVYIFIATPLRIALIYSNLKIEVKSVGEATHVRAREIVAAAFSKVQ